MYDLDRRLTLETRPDGSTIAPDYDTAGRLWHTTYPGGTITRGYDPSHGKLQSIAMPTGETLTYGYDGFLRTSVGWSGTVNGQLLLGYDSSFRVTSQQVGGASVLLGYDNDNLLTSAGPTASSMTIARDAQNGRVTGTTLGSISDTSGYDDNGDRRRARAPSGALPPVNGLLRDEQTYARRKTQHARARANTSSSRASAASSNEAGTSTTSPLASAISKAADSARAADGRTISSRNVVPSPWATRRRQ
ncbi:MAG: hypothetical protein FWD17_11995 [Polyangiaceae bacterium]|nr:hypothetical protein [Polyangiaceae bacterium]